MARKDWTVEELEFVKANYPTMGRAWIALQLNRTEMSVRLKANSLGLTTNKKPVDLSIEKYLRSNHTSKSSRQMALELNLSEKQIHDRLAKCGISKFRYNSFWNSEMDLELRTLSLTLTLAELTKHFNVQGPTLLKRAKVLGIVLTKAVVQTKWSHTSTEFLKLNYGTLSFKEIAKELRKTEAAVRRRADNLGLLTPKGYTSTTPEKIVASVLDSLDVNYQKEPRIKTHKTKTHFYKPDFLLDNNLVIEVQGDYWHCNPNVYSVPINNMQTKSKEKDRTKKQWYLDNNYTLLEIWESDTICNTTLTGIISDFVKSQPLS